VKSNSTTIEVDFGECLNNDYRFRINDRILLDKKRAYVCPCRLPLVLEVVDLAGDTISAITTWTGLEPNPENSYSAIIDSTVVLSPSISNNISVSFDAPSGEEVNLKIKLRKPVIQFTKSTETKFEFDNNEIEELNQYNSTSGNGIPFKFLLNEVNDKLYSDVYPNEVESVVTLDTIFRDTFPKIAFDPYLLDNNEGFVSADFIAPIDNLNGYNEYEIKACDTIPELKLVVADSVFRYITFIRVCESFSDCPPQPDIEQLLLDMNLISNKAGVFFRYDTSYEIVFPIDSLVNDGRNGVLEDNEQNAIFNIPMGYPSLGIEPIDDFDIIVFFTIDLGLNPDPPHTSILGNAIAFGYNKFLIDTAEDGATARAYVHEIGHASYSLAHPSEVNFGLANPDHGVTHDDPNNIMHNTSSSNSPNRFRMYQIKRIHND